MKEEMTTRLKKGNSKVDCIYASQRSSSSYDATFPASSYSVRDRMLPVYLFPFDFTRILQRMIFWHSDPKAFPCPCYDIYRVRITLPATKTRSRDKTSVSKFLKTSYRYGHETEKREAANSKKEYWRSEAKFTPVQRYLAAHWIPEICSDRDALPHSTVPVF